MADLFSKATTQFLNGREDQHVLNVVILFNFYEIYMVIEDSKDLLILPIGDLTWNTRFSKPLSKPYKNPHSMVSNTW